MSWPTPQDYNEAIQNPRVCLSDPELRTGIVVTNTLGLPKPYSGGFATVYEVDCGSRRWAVRCFQRELVDEQHRYEIIDRHLRSVRLPAMVGFEFLPQGIRVAGHWYPILKMEWVEGKLLNEYLAAHLYEPDVLTNLARQWVDLLGSLRRVGIAHGDLQHGNILIANDAMRLIDYDGMFVPGLAGQRSREEGHRNYQHPSRNGADFGPYLDNFSAWVIFLSISALAVEPRLWQLLGCGDESLLFRREDFQKPKRSKAFQFMEHSGRPELQALSAQFRSLLTLPLRDIPGLDGGSVSVADVTATSSARIPPGMPNWVAEHVAEMQEVGEGLLEHEPLVRCTQSAAWIIDHLIDQKPVPGVLTAVKFGCERALLVIVLAICGLCGFLLVVGAAPHKMAGAGAGPISVALYTLFLRSRYKSLGVVGEKLLLLREKLDREKKVQETKTALACLDSERERVLRPLVDLDAEYRAIPARLRSGLDNLRIQRDQLLDRIRQQQVSVGNLEHEGIHEIEAKFARDIGCLYKDLSDLDLREKKEIGELSAAIRDQHIQRCLQCATLSNALLPGIGFKMKARLYAHGVRCAADIDHRIYGVAGIGTSKSATLRAWRQRVEREAVSSAPAPAGTDVMAVKNKYVRQRENLLSQINTVRSNEGKERRSLVDKFSPRRKELDLADADARRQHDHDADALRSRFEHRKAEIADKFRQSKSSVDARKKELGIQMNQLQQSLFAKHFELCRIQRELDRYRRLSFPRYLARVIGLGAAA